MYAILSYCGEQHKVTEGQTICLNDLNLNKGDSIEFSDIMYVSKDGVSEAGTPYLDNIKVLGEVLGQKKDKKIVIFTYRKRKSSSRKMGHRQEYSLVKINKIEYQGV